MTRERHERPLDDPAARLEQALRQEFLQVRGVDERALAALPERERQRLLQEASQYVSGRLAEVRARAHLIEELHHEH